ncbi:unnamed protein product [Ectocarpus sp. CCAP 1310/34]|nr:unnamed protein product [Ectocarpus sp. CCAP 1310/34]
MRVFSRDIVRNSPDSLQACAWNMLLRRSHSIMASLDANNPWTPAGFGSRPAEYVAWHIRTSNGETKESFSPDVHQYIFNGQTSAAVFPLFLSATSFAEKACPKLYHDNIPIMPVYISSNSKTMSRNCTALAAENKIQSGFVDLGIADSDAHTGYSANPDATALNAFIDYLYLMDSSIIVQTGSSFAFTVASIKGTSCRGAPKTKGAPVRSLYICLPNDC